MYIVNYYFYSIASLSVLTMFYFPLHIFITSFLANHCRIRDLIAKIRELAKPVLCAALQSIAALAAFVFFVTESLDRIHFSWSLIISEILLLLIIVFSIVYSRIALQSIYSWLAGIALFVFSTPPLSQVLYLLSLYAIINPLEDWKYGLRPLLITATLIILFTLIQMISLKKISRSSLNGKKIYSLFALLFVSNLTAMVLIKCVAEPIESYKRSKW